MNPSAIPFEIPDRFLAAVGTGIVRRIGTTLRDRGTGRILAHLQETSFLPDAFGAGNPVGLILWAGRLASSIAANVQLEQVKSMLSTLQLLNMASLAASVVGIGVSAAGFSLVLQRVRNVEQRIVGLHQDVSAGRRAAERVDVRFATANQAEIDNLLSRAEEAWVRSDAVEVWKRLEGRLDEAQQYWRCLVAGRVGKSIFLDPNFTLEEAMAGYEAILILAAARIQILLLIEQLAGAQHYAREFCRWHEEVMFNLAAIDIATARSQQLAEKRGISEEDARSELLHQTNGFVKGIHEVHLHSEHRPALLQAIADKGLRGRDYVETLRGWKDSPLVVLPA